MKLGITGSRHWTNRQAIYRALDEIDPPPTVVIHGDAVGADRFAAQWAATQGIVCAIVRPVLQRPDLFLARNSVIVDLADKVIVFRAPGKSNGTDDTRRKAERSGKLLRVVTP